MKLESFLIHYKVLHYQKKLLPTRCTYVSCGPLVLVFFESPSASLDLSDASVAKVNAEAPTFALSSWISYLAFRHRAALDSANVNKYQPYKNLTILAVQIPAVQKWYWWWLRCKWFFRGATHWSQLSSPLWTWQKLGGNGETPRCAEAGLMWKTMLEASWGISNHHFTRQGLEWYPGTGVSFQRKTISTKHYKIFF